MGIVTAATAVYRAGKATLVTGTILVKVIFVTIMSYRNLSGISFYYIFSAAPPLTNSCGCGCACTYTVWGIR
jgi:hypothetical protein